MIEKMHLMALILGHSLMNDISLMENGDEKDKKTMGWAAMATALMALSAGCDKSFLERLPLTEISEANLWPDMYGRLDHGHKLNMLAVATDEAVHNHGWNTELIVQGTLTPDACLP